MSFDFSGDEHLKMNNFFDTVLKLHSSNKVSTRDARNLFAYVLTAAAIDNQNEVKAYLENDGILDIWLENIRGITQDPE